MCETPAIQGKLSFGEYHSSHKIKLPFSQDDVPAAIEKDTLITEEINMLHSRQPAAITYEI